MWLSASNEGKVVGKYTDIVYQVMFALLTCLPAVIAIGYRL